METLHRLRPPSRFEEKTMLWLSGVQSRSRMLRWSKVRRLGSPDGVPFSVTGITKISLDCRLKILVKASIRPSGEKAGERSPYPAGGDVSRFFSPVSTESEKMLRGA